LCGNNAPLSLSVCSLTAPGGNTVNRLICYRLRKKAQSIIEFHYMSGYGINQGSVKCTADFVNRRSRRSERHKHELFKRKN
jgi:hypothetical protein